MDSSAQTVHKLKHPVHLISMQAEILLYKPGISEEERRQLLFRIVELSTSLGEMLDELYLLEAKRASSE